MSTTEVERPTTLHNGDPLEYVIDPETYCNGFREDEGDPPAEHAEPDWFTLDDLIDMYRYADCPLHLHPDYHPGYRPTPEGVWKRDFYKATVELAVISSGHDGECATHRVAGICACADDCATLVAEVDPLHYTATAGELRSLWEQFPHARWAFERHADDGLIVIELVPG